MLLLVIFQLLVIKKKKQKTFSSKSACVKLPQLITDETQNTEPSLQKKLPIKQKREKTIFPGQT